MVRRIEGARKKLSMTDVMQWMCLRVCDWLTLMIFLGVQVPDPRSSFNSRNFSAHTQPSHKGQGSRVKGHTHRMLGTCESQGSRVTHIRCMAHVRQAQHWCWLVLVLLVFRAWSDGVLLPLGAGHHVKASAVADGAWGKGEGGNSQI